MIDSINDAKSSAISYSIAETAKANNLKPYDYFEHILNEMPKHMDDSDHLFLEDLLPWSEKLRKEYAKSNTGCHVTVLKIIRYSLFGVYKAKKT